MKNDLNNGIPTSYINQARKINTRATTILNVATTTTTRVENENATTTTITTTPTQTTTTRTTTKINPPQNIHVPRHIAFICDGNRRWAHTNNLPSSVGHAKGADRTISLLQTLAKSYSSLGIQVCTLYAFSTENWSRPASEISTLLQLMESSAKNLSNRACEFGIRVKILGDLEDERIPSSLRTALLKLEEDTSNHLTKEKLIVCLAINYGGRKDILQAALSYAQEESSNSNSNQKQNTTQTQTKQQLNEEEFEKHLSTAGLPDPDLIIRTAGECRLSNFLLWNAAYAELYFTEVLWPDFDEDVLKEALMWYEGRIRRFGT